MSHPDMASVEKRIETFNTWPRPEINVTRLAAAGFFFAPIPGYADRCIFYASGKALSNWNPADDPWAEYEKLFPQCPHVQREGNGRADGATSSARPQTSPPPTPPRSGEQRPLSGELAPLSGRGLSADLRPISSENSASWMDIPGMDPWSPGGTGGATPGTPGGSSQSRPTSGELGSQSRPISGGGSLWGEGLLPVAGHVAGQRGGAPSAATPPTAASPPPTPPRSNATGIPGAVKAVAGITASSFSVVKSASAELAAAGWGGGAGGAFSRGGVGMDARGAVAVRVGANEGEVAMRVSAEIAELVAATRTQVVLLLQQQKQQQRELQAQLDESRQQLAMEQAKLQQAQREIQAKDRQIVSLIRKEQKSPSANSGVDLLQGQHDFSANVLDA
jgi:hypothetical protein